jgi:hypothetical protein
MELFVGVVLVVAGAVALGLMWYCHAVRRRADRRADALLRHLLSPAELDNLRTHGYLDVPSRCSPERIYRIPAAPGVVTVMDSGVPIAWLCSQPTVSIPAREHVLISKLVLEGAEAEFWARANRVSVPYCRFARGASVEIWTAQGPGVLGSR